MSARCMSMSGNIGHGWCSCF
uniref:Uncharacterized protein n=1 Tax=Musa acuminata subsp. malaccensis TaxID=214687 RepID=A0A804IU04_MUSAM